MRNRCARRRPSARAAVGLLLAPLALAALSGPGGAAEADAPAPTAATPAAPLGLEECRALALRCHPRLKAKQASLAAAQDGLQALEALRLAGCLERDLPVRRQQAALGVTAAAADLDRTSRDVVYEVTRAYLSVQLARAQEKLTRGVVDRLSTTLKVAGEQLKEGAPGVSDTDIDRTTVYLRLAEARHIEAAQGEQRALALLREALGQGPGCPVDVAPAPLPSPDVQLRREEAVAAALARRGDLAQTRIFAEVACLEVDAQSATHALRVETFAAGADIHSRQVQQQSRSGTEFRPGATPPEMPTLLAGKRQDRMQHAGDLAARAEAVAEGTRNLIILDAEEAFLRWQEAAAQAGRAREAAELAERLANNLDRDYLRRLKVTVNDVVTARVLAAQARAQYNQYLFSQDEALADLERATGGALCVPWAAAPPQRAPQPK